MNKLIFITLLLLTVTTADLIAQYNYESNSKNPYGSANPLAPDAIKDYDSLIGVSTCSSVSRAPDGTWNPEVSMQWKFRYIMNGNAVQDETLKADGVHSGSIRQYNPETGKWYVHYYTTGSVAQTLPSWEGSVNEDGNMVLYRKQQAPNGTEGYYRLTFYDIKPTSFNWIGEWVSTDESIVYPTWKISCTKTSNK